MPDLSPESLAAVTAVRAARADIENRLGDWCVTDTQCPETREHLDWPEAFDRYLLAVRDATLKAERERLLALTPEAVVEAAAKAMAAHDENGHDFWDEMSEDGERADYRARVRAALPLLLAPEVAKREAVEKERDEAVNERVRTLELLASSERTAAKLIAAAEAERDRMREALEKAEGIVSRFVKARDAFHYDYFGGEVERHLERAMEDAYGFLHGLPDDLRAALGGSNG